MLVDLYGNLNEADMSDARLAMHGRILRCPMGGNPDDCPLHDIRLLPIYERIGWLGSKTDEEVEELFHQHTDCLERKIAEQQAE